MANMTQTMALDELYNRWFQIADTDRDGRVMGQEAVAFLTRSGLPPATLGKIWEVAAQGAPWLDQASFRRVCQLMWYAQQNGNDLPADSRGVVMKIISGMATLPPPKLVGEESPFALRDMRPIGIDLPQPAQQFSQSGSYMSQPTGASSIAAAAAAAAPPHSHNQSMHSQSLPPAAPSAHFQSGSTGQSFTSAQTGGAPAQVPGAVSAGPTGQPQYPDITTFLAKKYGDTFKAAAKDQAGDIPGGECLRLLGAVPVDIAVKKEAWDLVAGEKGALNPQEFFTLLYLLDLHTVNHSLPDSIPQGIFPPGVHQCFSGAGLPVPGVLQPPTVAHVPLAQQNPVENLALEAEMFKDEKWSMEKHQEEEHDPLAALPSVPPKTTFEAPDEQPYNADSRLPSVESKKVSALSNASERERLQTSMKAATKLDKELYEAEVKFANAQQENDFYVASLQQLTIFKSRSERALLDTQSRADSAHREAQETRQRYEQMYANARAQASTAQDLQRHITEAMASKAEWESKVAVLQQELQALANATPELLEQLQYEVEELKGSVGASEAEKRAFEDQTAGLRASKAQLEDRVKTVKDELKTAQELMEEALISLNNAKQELDFTKTGEDAESLQAALEEASAAYKALHIKACSAGVPVPKEAMIQSNENSVWSKEDMIGARDWMKFADAGWTVMEDLPELPEIFDTTFYIAHNQSEPPDVIVPIIMSDDPFVEAEDIEDAPPRVPADADAAAAAANGAQPPAAAAPAAAAPADAAPAAAAAGAVAAAGTAAAAASAPAAGTAVDPAAPAAIAEGMEGSQPRAAAGPAAPSAEAAPAPGDAPLPTAAEPTAGAFDSAAAAERPADPAGPAALPMDLFSAPAPDPSTATAAAPATAPAAAAASLGGGGYPQRSFETFIPQDGSADASPVPSNAAAILQEMPSEGLSVPLPGQAPNPRGGDTADMLKYAPTPAPTAELSSALGLSAAIGGPCSPPDTSDTNDIQKFAPTPAPTAELGSSHLLPDPRRSVGSTGVPSLAAAAEAAASGTSAGDITDITTAAPTPAPTAELSNSHLLPTAGRTVDSLGVPSLAAAAAAAASSGATAASGPLGGGASNPLPSLSIPEQEESVPALAQGVPVTPGSTSGIAPNPTSRSVKSSLSGLGKHTSVTSELSGALPGLSGRLMAPTPANSAALSMAGNSGVIDPSGQGYPGVRAMPQRGAPLSLSQVAAKLQKHDAGSSSSTNHATPTFDPSEMAASPPDAGGPMQQPAPGVLPPGVLPEESMEILEISASLPLAQPNPPAAARGPSGQGGAPPAVFASSNPFAGGTQAPSDSSNPQPPPGPVAEGTAQDSSMMGNSSMLGGTDSVFGWPDAGAAKQGKSR